MSRVDNAINEIVHIDELANDNQWINKIHPLVKFVITILFICPPNFLLIIICLPFYSFLFEATTTNLPSFILFSQVTNDNSSSPYSGSIPVS